ncbi:hypothetical protein D3C72_2248930 [compost metagenome]
MQKPRAKTALPPAPYSQSPLLPAGYGQPDIASQLLPAGYCALYSQPDFRKRQYRIEQIDAMTPSVTG